MDYSKIEILCDSHHGIYIPEIMIPRLLGSGWTGLPSDANDHTDPDSEWYWENWEMVLNNAQFTDENGHIWSLYHDGDLFAIRDDYNFNEEY